LPKTKKNKICLPPPVLRPLLYALVRMPRFY
jgi:hypothetical protein